MVEGVADRTRDPRVIAFAQRQVTHTDWVFTAGGVALVLLTGLANVGWHGIRIETQPWLVWGLALFTASGAVWVAILIPLQARLARLAREFAEDRAIPAQYWRLCRQWNICGAVATLLPVAALYFMVFKNAA